MTGLTAFLLHLAPFLRNGVHFLYPQITVWILPERPNLTILDLLCGHSPRTLAPPWSPSYHLPTYSHSDQFKVSTNSTPLGQYRDVMGDTAYEASIHMGTSILHLRSTSLLMHLGNHDPSARAHALPWETGKTILAPGFRLGQLWTLWPLENEPTERRSLSEHCTAGSLCSPSCCACSGWLLQKELCLKRSYWKLVAVQPIYT